MGRERNSLSVIWDPSHKELLSFREGCSENRENWGGIPNGILVCQLRDLLHRVQVVAFVHEGHPILDAGKRGLSSGEYVRDACLGAGWFVLRRTPLPLERDPCDMKWGGVMKKNRREKGA